MKLGTVSANLETATRSGEFFALAKHLAVSDSLSFGPETEAAVAALPPRVRDIIKSGITPGSLGDPNWSALAPYTTIAGAFLESLRGVSVFDTLLNSGMRKVPLHRALVVASSAITGSTPSELSVKPISSMALAGNDIAVRKAAAVIVMTSELFKFAPSGSALFSSELKNGVAVAADSQFLADLYAGVTPTASAGTTIANVMTDLAALLGGLTIGDGSRIFVIISPANILKLMLKLTSGGNFAFPNLGLNGGEILPGVTVLPSTAVPSGAILAIDATGLAGDTELPFLRSITHGDVTMDTSPDSPATAATTLHSLWQANERAIYAERFFGFKQVRDGAVAALSGAAY